MGFLLCISVKLNDLNLLVFTELAITMKYGEGSYITLFLPSDVTAFWGCYITLFSPSNVTVFYRMKYGGGGVI